MKPRNWIDVTYKEDIIRPGLTGSAFRLALNSDWYINAGTELATGDGHIILIVIEGPYRSKWRLFLQQITFGLYRAPWTYKAVVPRS